MKVVELTNVQQRETPLLYRRTFTATAVLAHGSRTTDAKRVEFTLEHMPLGPVAVTVRFLDDLDYPVVPAANALKKHIEKMQQNGDLR
ncbi:MAG: hypothetical protein ACOC1I_08830 [Spirochaetota bacterium]